MKKNTLNKSLIKILLEMSKKDQKLRHLAEKTNEWVRVQRTDKNHMNKLKSIINKNGWPTISSVGARASSCAWLIAQHSDQDLPFQKKCLKLMRAEFATDPRSVDKKNIAYLTDRVLINSGRKQLFGTQFKRLKDGTLKLSPLADKKYVDKRRGEFGMESLKIYLRKDRRLN